jgi:predicted O-methyltransferase YrrM
MKLAGESKIISLETDKNVMEIAKKILAHCDVKNVELINKSLYESEEILKKEGPFDLIFMDHDK